MAKLEKFRGRKFNNVSKQTNFRLILNRGFKNELYISYFCFKFYSSLFPTPTQLSLFSKFLIPSRNKVLLDICCLVLFYLVHSQEPWVEVDEVHTPGSLGLQAEGSCTGDRRVRGRGRV